MIKLGKCSGLTVKYENLTLKKEIKETKDDFDNLINRMFKHKQQEEL